MAVTVVAAEVHVAVLIVDAIAKTGIAQVRSTAGHRIYVGDVIKVQAIRPCIGNRKHTLPDAAVDGQIPRRGIGALDVLVDGTLADRWQGFATRACQRPGSAGVHRHRRNIPHAAVGGLADEANHGIIRRVLDGVEGHVAEVTFVADRVTSAKGGFTVAEDIPGKANARSKVAVVGLPEDATIPGQFNSSVANLIENGSARTHNEVGVERWIGIVLHAVVLPAETRVERETGYDLPGILYIPRPVVVAVVAVEGWCCDRQRQRAGGADLDDTGRILGAREFALRIHSPLELVDVSRAQIGKPFG